MPNDKFICAAPWSHLMLYASGEMATCWASQPYSQEQRSLGQLQSDGIEDLWNNTNIKEVRKAFINGQIPLQCHSCFRLESHNSPSDRQTNFNFDFVKLEEKIKKTEPDGSLDCKEVNSLELMLSNVCNFTCRTCNVSNSSAWANEHQFLYKTRIDSPVRRPFQNPDQTANKVFNLAPNIKRLSFIGGEPLIQPEHFKLLNLLIESGKTNVILCYTTNLSELTFRNQDILELWKKFDHIYLTISLDGIRQKGEYIRKGFKWDKFQENLKKINSVLSNINFCCNITV
jgi:radical SAM protein with 4Fe4S-binding SPASM domain